MKVLVTGGAGFIGSAVCRRLHSVGATVINVDALTYASARGTLATIEGSARYFFERVDIRDASEVARVFAQYEPDRVMHLAAESHVDRSISAPGTFVETNIVGTYNLLSAAHSYWSSLDGDRMASFRFLHVSTDEVYGSLGPTGLFTECTPYDPRSPYAASKAASDHLASAWYHTYGLPVVISNCSNNYGPFHFPEKLIPLAILNALEWRTVSLYGDGSNVRDWLHVEDHARALHLIATEGLPGRSYNVGGRAERTNLQVVEAICDLLDELTPRTMRDSRRALITFVADRPGHDTRYAIDPSRIETELGWRAEEDFESGLRNTVTWYLANRAWWQPLRETYAGERLGLVKGA